MKRVSVVLWAQRRWSFSKFASNCTAEAFKAVGKPLHALEPIYCRIEINNIRAKHNLIKCNISRSPGVGLGSRQLLHNSEMNVAITNFKHTF